LDWSIKINLHYSLIYL